MRYTKESWTEILDLLSGISDFPANGRIEVWSEWDNGKVIFHIET